MLVHPVPAPDEDSLPIDALGASLFDASEDCVKIIGLDGRLLAMNLNGICLMEIDDFAPLRGQPWASLWPEQHRAVIEASMAEAREGRGSRFSATCPTAKGTEKAWDVALWPVLDDQGRPVRLVSISRDITERVRAEEENALFARELAHRIKNMFAIVDGVISLSARAALGAKPFADALRQRLAGLGRAIAYVTPPDLMGVDIHTHTLHGLLKVLLEPYGAIGGDDPRVEIVGDDVFVGRTATTSLALIANELATNALKYGALSGAQGHVRVTAVRDGETLDLTWEEHGQAARETDLADTGEGFGSVLLDNAVVRQLGGRLTREWGAGGIVVGMRFPLERIER